MVSVNSWGNPRPYRDHRDFRDPLQGKTSQEMSRPQRPRHLPARYRDNQLVARGPSSLRVAKQKLRYIELMNLACSLVDTEGAHIAVEAFDTAFLHPALSAENLHDLVGHPAAHFRRVIFAKGYVHRDVLAIVALTRGLQNHRPRGFDLDLAIGEHSLHELEFADRLAELTAFARIGDPLVEHPNGRPGEKRGEIDALLVQCLHHCSKAAVEPVADDRVRLNDAILEEDFADRGAFLSHFRRRRRGTQAGRPTLDKKGRDSFGVTCIAIGA